MCRKRRKRRYVRPQQKEQTSFFCRYSQFMLGNECIYIGMHISECYDESSRG